MTNISIDQNIIHFTGGFIGVCLGAMILYSFRGTISYVGNRLLYWICRLMQIPIIGEYYIQRDTNPYRSCIVQVLDEYERTIEFKYLKSDHDKIGARNIADCIQFSRVYKWIHKDEIQRFIKDDKIINEISPLFQISDYDVYHIGKYWYIISQGGDIDVDHSPRYLALSIALINHDL